MLNLNDFCDEWLRSWSGNQPDKLIDFYTVDAFYSDPAFPLGLNGKDNILSYFKKLLAKNPDWKWEREILMPTSEGFSLIWKAQIPLKDKIISTRGMDRVVLSHQKISRNEVYFDASVLNS